MTDTASTCICQNLNDRPSLLDIRHKSESGCDYCRLIYDAVSDLTAGHRQVGDTTDTSADIAAKSYIELLDECVKIHWNNGEEEYFQIFNPDSFAMLSSLEKMIEKTDASSEIHQMPRAEHAQALHYFLGSEFDHCKAIKPRKLVSEPGSQSAFDLIQEWVGECSEKHTICSQYAGTLKMPRRILCIEYKNGIYSVYLQGSPEDEARYIALSHCWGEKPPLTTTTKNEIERRNGINWDQLPLTFQHAVQMCAGLGIKYLWIDSLCILQDSEADWVQESEKMALIYANAWLTIAAAAAPDSTYGCLPQPNAVKKYSLPAKSSEEAPRRVYARRLRTPFHSRDHLLHVSSELSLFQWAWVFQERILAKRVLYMCEDEMVFECFSNIRCECSDICTEEVQQTMNRTDYAGIKYRFQGLVHQWSMYSYGFSKYLRFEPTGILEVWDQLVHQYALRKMTYHSDRLPGFGGIAAKFSGTGAIGSYCAGLWAHRLEECLLWYVFPATADVTPLPPNRKTISAPSWSWASVNGSWDYRRISHRALYVKDGAEMSLVSKLDRTKLADVVGVQLNLEKASPFTKISRGALELKARKITAKVKYERSDQNADYAARFRLQSVTLALENSKSEIEAYMDFVLDYEVEGSKIAPILPNDVVKCIGILRDWDSGRGPLDTCHGLVVACRLQKELLPIIETMSGSSLKDAEVVEKSVYERIGKFKAPFAWFEGAETETFILV